MHIIKVCTGCSCEKRFAEETLKAAEEALGIKAGESTPDGQFKLEKTGCLSHCSSGPSIFLGKNENSNKRSTENAADAVLIDGEVISGMLPHRLQKKIKELKQSNS